MQLLSARARYCLVIVVVVVVVVFVLSLSFVLRDFPLSNSESSQRSFDGVYIGVY